jgi:hypothetical protein
MSTSTFYTPPPGFQFRLCGKVSEKALYSSAKIKPAVFHTPRKDVQENQWFYLIHGSGPRAGKFAIKGKESDRVIFSRRHNDPFVDHIGGNGSYDDNWHVFENADRFPGWFRIITPVPANVALVSRNDPQPNVFNHPAKEFYEDQLFQFDFEEIEVTSVDWDLAAAQVSATGSGEVVADVVVKNNSHLPQLFSLNHPGGSGSGSGSADSVGVWVEGFPLDKSVKLTSGLPAVKNGRVVIENSRIEWSLGVPVTPPGGNTNGNSNGTAPGVHSFTVGPQLKMRAVARAGGGGSFEVPFTIALKGKRSGTAATTKGVWRGSTPGSDVQYELRQVM